MEPIWIKCGCGSHAVQIFHYDDDPELYMSFWSHGFDMDHRPTFWHRFKCAWKTLWTNSCHGHEVVLDMRDANKLIIVLQDIVGGMVRGLDKHPPL